MLNCDLFLFQFEEISSDRDCVLECGPDKTCFPDTCCATAKKAANNLTDLPPNPNLRQRSNCQMVPNGECQEFREGGDGSHESASSLQKPSMDKIENAA